jgi:prophage antirepressor-like protein
MTVTVMAGAPSGKEHQIKLSGTIDDPYFCGKDVCNVLGYETPKDALQRYVEHDDKQPLQHLRSTNPNKLGPADRPNLLGSFEPLTYRTGKAVYVNESGLYSLILSSEAPFAKEFRRLVCKVILPSIRKYGCYHAETKLSEAMEQLAIKEQSEEELRREQEELKDKLVRAERKAIRVNKFMRRVVIKEKKLEWIYIATTKMYAGERLFKIGSTTRLGHRIGGYNTGRPKEDAYYYCWVKKCYNSKDLDYHIQKLLVDFKHRDNAELYCGIKFSDLRDIVCFIIDHYDESIDYINNFIRTRLDASLEEDDEEPPRLNYKKFTYQIGEHTETIDLEQEDADLIQDELENIFGSIRDQMSSEGEGVIVVDRKELVDKLVKVTNMPRREVWMQVKEHTGWTNSKTEIDFGRFKVLIQF